MSADPLKLAQTIGDQVKKGAAVYLRGPDFLPTDVVTDAPFYTVSDDSTVKSVQLLAGDNLSSGATFLVNAYFNGIPLPIASIASSGVQKMIPKDGTILLPIVPAGCVLAVTITKSGGITLPPCMISVAITPNPPAS